MRFSASLLLLAVILAAPAGLQAEAASPSPQAEPIQAEVKPSPKADHKPAKEKKSDVAEFDIPVPIGPPIKGLKVPHYDEDGNLMFLFDAEVARKVDASHIEMENLKIDAYSDDGKKFYIEMPAAVFNLETRILDGDQKVLVRREDFEILGDAGEFHTKTRFAKIIGKVKMTIFSTDNLEKP